MYLWKYWRESRLAFSASMAGIAILLMAICCSKLVENSHVSVGGFVNFVVFTLFFQAVPIGFVAWIFGSFGAGHDLSEKSGSYLFSRPRSRAFFVWCDWGFGLGQLLVIVVALNATIGVWLYRSLLYGGDPYHGSVPVAGQFVPLLWMICLNCAGAFLIVALVFGLTYFSTILVRPKGVMLGAAILLAYILIKQVAKLYWPWVVLPGIIPMEYATSGDRVTGLVDHLGIFLAVRALLMLLFPIGAQLLLEQRDVE